MKMSQKTKKLVMAALLAAMTCVATLIIKIPTPLKGYVNLGDGIVLVAGWMLSPAYGFAAAGLGSALADVILGYVTYAPATFLIKGAMALMACYGQKWLRPKWGALPARIAGGLTAEIWMIVGYYVFEGVLYGFAPSVVNIPGNGFQAVVGLMVGTVLMQVCEKNKGLSKWK